MDSNMENENDTAVDMTILEAVHADLFTDAKIMIVMMLSSIREADPEKNKDAITEAIDFCADTMAHKIALQYALRKGLEALELNDGAVSNAKKSMIGFCLMAQACLVHQNMRERLKPVFREQWDKLRAKQAGNLNRLN